MRETSQQTLQDLDAAFIRKMTQLTSASPKDLRPLSRVLKSPQNVAKGDVVIDSDETKKRLFLVTSGWLCASAALPPDRRQIYHIYQEGDVIGFEDLRRDRHSVSVVALTAGRLCAIDPPDMINLLKTQTGLANALHAMSTLNHVIMMDRMKTIARQDPRERVAHFLLEMANRVRVTSKYHSGESGNSLTFNLPLVQGQLADCLGLTAVHVSRTLTGLKQDGLISRPSRSLITIKDEAALVSLANYRNRYQRRS